MLQKNFFNCIPQVTKFGTIFQENFSISNTSSQLAPRINRYSELKSSNSHYYSKYGIRVTNNKYRRVNYKQILTFKRRYVVHMKIGQQFSITNHHYFHVTLVSPASQPSSGDFRNSALVPKVGTFANTDRGDM